VQQRGDGSAREESASSGDSGPGSGSGGEGQGPEAVAQRREKLLEDEVESLVRASWGSGVKTELVLRLLGLAHCRWACRVALHGILGVPDKWCPGGSLWCKARLWRCLPQHLVAVHWPWGQFFLVRWRGWQTGSCWEAPDQLLLLACAHMLLLCLRTVAAPNRVGQRWCNCRRHRMEARAHPLFPPLHCLSLRSNTQVGDALIRGISGGERKRLTTAEMAVGPRRVLLMDEISTGLDSATLFSVITFFGAVRLKKVH
jgi:hypothetical protein